ncbi:uncharacterized protein LOC113563074 [Ooceraea biroi]|uniref:uncharacterized protein LOC113563074 n=1 Tax=Ooceraea biroi TaxID=2015173 RepID=UPI000F07A15C|nr:uncharacterized protein LOC113563074 [Ooceraea biroi]
MLHPTNAEPVVEEILNRTASLEHQNEIIIFIWIPSHIGIKGNEQADKAAKKALSLQQQDHLISHNDLIRSLKNNITNTWNQQWLNLPTTKLHTARNNIYEKTPLLPHRIDQVILTRLRIGHTRVTHSYIIKKIPQELCNHCRTPLTVPHILRD